MMIIKTEIEIGQYLGDSPVDGIPLRKVSPNDLHGINNDEYEIVKGVTPIINDLDQAKQEHLRRQR